MLRVGNITIKLLEFPEPARTYQRANDLKKLSVELGNNYDVYHSFLRQAWTKLGGRPDPASFVDIQSYLGALQSAWDILEAEILLRLARTSQRTGAGLDVPWDTTQGLLDASGGLVMLPSSTA